MISVPLWVYCNNTLRNISKKWNKHNSILFTLAGLSPKLVHLLTNIHFLATSNVAPPLKMFNAVVKMLLYMNFIHGCEYSPINDLVRYTKTMESKHMTVF